VQCSERFNGGEAPAWHRELVHAAADQFR
jgi:hypothetical protein